MKGGLFGNGNGEFNNCIPLNRSGRLNDGDIGCSRPVPFGEREYCWFCNATENEIQRMSISWPIIQKNYKNHYQYIPCKFQRLYASSCSKWDRFLIDYCLYFCTKINSLLLNLTDFLQGNKENDSFLISLYGEQLTKVFPKRNIRRFLKSKKDNYMTVQ